MRIWLDDVRYPPLGYNWCKSVNFAKKAIENAEKLGIPIDVIDCDHDLGKYAVNGGDGIKLLDWLVERNSLYEIRIHTSNPVGRDNMLRMLNRYWGR